MTFRSRLFLSSIAAAAVTLAVATALMSWSIRASLRHQIESGLVNEARLAAETLSHRRPATPAELDAEADAMGRLISARVTFVAPDGSVVGDSERRLDELASLENHLARPEIEEALNTGVGRSTRFSTTLDEDMLYVAARVQNPHAPQLAVVRLALPLTGIREELSAVFGLALVAFGVALVAALALAWSASMLLTRRVRAIATVADRYAAGDFSQPARDYGSDEIGTVARVLDESAREAGRRASELESDRARMAAILAGMIEGVLVVDDRGRLLLVNDAARRMLKLHDAPEGRHYLEIVRHPEVAAQLGQALGGATGEGLELTLPREPGVMYIARSAPVRSSAAKGAVLVLHDITALRRADQIRRDFVANVSHELRTPLTAVRGYVEALLDGDMDGPDARRFLETIARHTTRMERLVRDLLRLARLDAHQEPFERAQVRVSELFDGVVAELDAEIDARRQAVVYDIARDAETVAGDPAKLHDTLRNLVENASNYAPEGGRITVGAAREHDRIVLTVSDDGPGIPESDLPRVFERFYRVDKSRTRSARDPGGTGLGLAIVKHLVELHGGTVSAHNGPAGGAVLRVELPAA